jgi:hypothetical protein
MAESKYIQKKSETKKTQEAGPTPGQEKNKKKPIIIMMDSGKEFQIVPGADLDEIKFSKGGRAGFKAGSKGCKLAMKGRGRAYGKNS